MNDYRLLHQLRLFSVLWNFVDASGVVFRLHQEYSLDGYKTGTRDRNSFP